MIKFVILTFLLIFVGCASLSQNKIIIESSPREADVFLYDTELKTYQKLGKTPLNFNNSIQQKYLKENKSSFIALKIEKPGFAVEHIIFDLNTRKRFSYLLELKKIEIWTDNNQELSSILANNIARSVQEINQLILIKDLDKALVKVEQMSSQYPKSDIFYDIKGSIYLLKGQKQRAIISFKKSLSINPDNIESESMLKALTKVKI